MRQAHVRHLRLPFNALLSPIYLYGLLSGTVRAGAGPGTPFPAVEAVLAWLSLHVFLYGGATAFNSYYDRDEGPVGGMLHPPAVDRRLLPFSLAVQAAGLGVAAWIGSPFALAWSILFFGFVAYSHPSVRLKARPAAALAAIALGQGAVGFALGWLVVAPSATLASPSSAAAMLATALVVSGLYLVTQSYQTVEDRRRNDRTLPVLLGSRRALRIAVATLAAGGALLALDLQRMAGWGVAVPLGAAVAGLAGFLLRWASGFEEADLLGNYRRAMGVVVVAGAGLSAVLLALLLGVAPDGPHAALVP